MQPRSVCVGVWVHQSRLHRMADGADSVTRLKAQSMRASKGSKVFLNHKVHTKNLCLQKHFHLLELLDF